jgi:hypothetical protein
VAVDTKRRETDIMSDPFYMALLSHFIPFCEICAAKMDEVEHSRLLLRGEFIDRVWFVLCGFGFESLIGPAPLAD